MYDVTIVGCGVIGASLAYTLSRYQLRVLVLEKENDVAMGTTKANSAVVHAGYDPANGTLMAKLNVQGSAMMEELCRKLSVKYKRTGSFVVAFDEEQRAHLGKMLENGKKNGVPGLQLNAPQRGVKPNYAYFPVVFDEKTFGASRNEVFDALAQNGIGARKYFYPLTNTFACFHNRYDVDKTPVARQIAERVLTLPLYADLPLADVDRICDVVLALRR